MTGPAALAIIVVTPAMKPIRAANHHCLRDRSVLAVHAGSPVIDPEHAQDDDPDDPLELLVRDESHRLPACHNPQKRRRQQTQHIYPLGMPAIVAGREEIAENEHAQQDARGFAGVLGKRHRHQGRHENAQARDAGLAHPGQHGTQNHEEPPCRTQIIHALFCPCAKTAVPAYATSDELYRFGGRSATRLPRNQKRCCVMLH